MTTAKPLKPQQARALVLIANVHGGAYSSNRGREATVWLDSNGRRVLAHHGITEHLTPRTIAEVASATLGALEGRGLVRYVMPPGRLTAVRWVATTEGGALARRLADESRTLALVELMVAAGWCIPADSYDPYVIEVCANAALKLGADRARVEFLLATIAAGSR